MRQLDKFPRPVREIMTEWIPMPDGKRLAARIWLPEDAGQNPVPAVLEYLPYRRRDGTANRDSVTQPYLAGHGYAAVRIDIRGTGDSEGLMLDEYDFPEQQDGAEAIQWLARQPWCSGSVGMWGISWGGINSLQVAALAPPALKAIMPMGFIDDRYNGDCHFMGGCLLEGNMSWGHTLFTQMAYPPDPAVVGEDWHQQWRERLESITPPMATWLSHQRRDRYWTAGSVCEDYSRIKCPVYAINGWQDSYARSILPLMERLSVPRKALIGPWAHAWPHAARPGPAIGFLQEALRWWNYWLKGIDTGIMDEPMVRVWMGEWIKPSKLVTTWPGRWVAEENWPAKRPPEPMALSAAGLGAGPAKDDKFEIRSPETNGLRAGYQCSYGLGPDLSDDQRIDDAESLCFDSAPLTARVEILGEPAIELDIAVDKPQALLAVRLCDVAPDGASLRLSYGLLNLSHRDSESAPAPLVPGQRYRIRIPLCATAYAFPAGHRIRLALSTAYWPIAWPSREKASVTLHGKQSRLLLPVRKPDAALDESLAPFGEPEGAAPRAILETRARRTDKSQDRLEEESSEGRVTLLRNRDRGAWKTMDSDVEYDSTGLLKFSIQKGDPLSAVQDFDLTTTIGRPGWRIRTETRTQISATASDFVLKAEMKAFLNDRAEFARSWDYKIPRDNL
jgi:hypothetical protein